MAWSGASTADFRRSPRAVAMLYELERSLRLMIWAESCLHGRFAHCRLGGEWFALQPEDVAWICAITDLEAEPDKVSTDEHNQSYSTDRSVFDVTTLIE